MLSADNFTQSAKCKTKWRTFVLRSYDPVSQVGSCRGHSLPGQA